MAPTATQLVNRVRAFLSQIDWAAIFLQAGHRLILASWLLTVAAIVLASRTKRAVPVVEDVAQQAAEAADATPMRLSGWGFFVADMAVMSAFLGWVALSNRGLARREALGAIIAGGVVAVVALVTLLKIRGG